MPERGFLPNEFPFGLLIRGYCRAGHASQGLELLEVMSSMEVAPNIVVYNTLVSTFCKDGKTDEAGKLVERIREDGLVPNDLRDMQVDKELGLPQPNTITYNLMLDGFCKEGMIEEAKILVESVKESGVSLEVESYNIWLLGLVRNAKLLEAQLVLNEMAEKGIRPTIVTYNIMMDGLCKNSHEFNEKWLLIILLHGYCKKGKISEANKLVGKMIVEGCFPNNYTCNSLLVWKEGKVLEAEELLSTMKERGYYALDTVTYNIVLDGLCKSGIEVRPAQ
ncbi:hypothetical protein OSB04_014522, partial [Centaurea solstitialis]